MPDVLRPLFDQVVIKELEPERMRKSGLLVPQGTHDLPPNEGIVLAVGDGGLVLQRDQDGSWERLKICGDSTCQEAYFDASMLLVLNVIAVPPHDW